MCENFHWEGIRDLNDSQKFTKFIDREFCALNCADNFMETFLFRDSEWAMPRKRGRCFIVTRLKCEVFGEEICNRGL